MKRGTPEKSATTVEALKNQVENLKNVIEQLKYENQTEIQQLNSQVALYKNMVESPLSLREENLVNEIMELKRKLAEVTTQQNSSIQKEISNLKLTIAQLNNDIAKQDANNAKLTIENLNLINRNQKLFDALEQSAKGTNIIKQSFEHGASSLIQSQLDNHQETTTRLEKMDEQLSQFQIKFRETEEKLHNVQLETAKFKLLNDRNEKAVEYLSRSLSLIADLPIICPDARTLAENPDQLIKLVDAAETTCRKEKNALQSELIETSRTLSTTIAKTYQPHLSQPVARVLTNLGAVIMDVSEQMNEEHKRTMKLLTGDDDDLSDDFLDQSIDSTI